MIYGLVKSADRTNCEFWLYKSKVPSFKFLGNHFPRNLWEGAGTTLLGPWEGGEIKKADQLTRPNVFGSETRHPVGPHAQ